MQKNIWRTQKGFTLIELLIVIGIIVVTVSAVFTVQGRFLVDTYLDTNTDQIVQNLRLAQMRSITRFKDSTWGVYFDEDIGGNNDKYIFFNGSDYASRDSSYDIETNLPDSIALSNINLNGGTDYIIFDKVTGETSDYGSIEISDNQGGGNTISINSKGVIASEGALVDPPALTQASYLTIDTSGANIAGGGDKELRGVTVENTSGSDIVIAKITSTWTNGKLIEEIKIEGTKIWKHNNEGSPNGRQPTGTEIDVVDYTVTAGSTDEFDKFKFKGDMSGDMFTILFEMGDESTKSITGLTPADG